MRGQAQRAELTRYVVPSWGLGELWTSDTLVLAHEFRFGADGQADEGDDLWPPLGGRHAPSSTLSRKPQRVGNELVSSSQRRSADTDDGRTSAGSFADFADSRPAASKPAIASPRPPAPRIDVDDLVRRFRAYLRGDDVRFDDIPIDLGGATPFQRAVARQLRRIPRGDVLSYGELAALAGYPGAARAAGTFCARNRFMFILPCHRVVGASGIGGYGSAGVAIKRRLLELESVVL